MVMIVAAPEHYTDFAAVVDGEPPEAIFEMGTASISCSSTFAGEIDVRIEADYSVTAVEQLMMVMVMLMVMVVIKGDGRAAAAVVANVPVRATAGSVQNRTIAAKRDNTTSW